MNFLQKLDYLMARDGLNKHTLSFKSGIPYTTIDAFYKKGYSNAKMGTIRKLSDVFDVTLDYFMEDAITDENYGKRKSNILSFPNAQAWSTPLVEAYANAQRPTREAACNVLQIPYVKPGEEPEPEIVPTAAFPSAAGIPVWIGSGDMENKEYPPGVVPSGTSFAIPIAGDSMEPTIPDGSYVFVKQQPDIRNNEIGVFMLYDEATCKRYYKDKNGVKLLSDNPKYDPIVVEKDAEGFGLVGKVLGHWLPE